MADGDDDKERSRIYGLVARQHRAERAVMEPSLTPEHEAILAKLREDDRKHNLTPDEMAQVRRGLALIDSFGIFARFTITLAALITAITFLIPFWPWGNGK